MSGRVLVMSDVTQDVEDPILLRYFFWSSVHRGSWVFGKSTGVTRRWTGSRRIWKLVEGPEVIFPDSHEHPSELATFTHNFFSFNERSKTARYSNYVIAVTIPKFAAFGAWTSFFFGACVVRGVVEAVFMKICLFLQPSSRSWGFKILVQVWNCTILDLSNLLALL